MTDLRRMERIHSAAILASGTEILMGQINNTNAQFLAQQLRDIGITSHYQLVVGDNVERMKACLSNLLAVTDCVLVTGGLGPTEDDISMFCASEVSGIPLCPHEPTRKHLEIYYARSGRKMSPNNLKQTLLPAESDGLVLPNENGTAPGAIFRFRQGDNLKHIILLPGPPLENRPMFLQQVRPYLEARSPQFLRSVFVRFCGIGESQLVTELQDLIAEQSNPTLATYVSVAEVALRITQTCEDMDDPDLIEPLLVEIRKRLGEFIYTECEENLLEVIRHKLNQEGKRIAVAESCTAGLVSSMLGSVSGISSVFLGGIVAYDPRVKEEVLGVSADLIRTEGTVNASVARELAIGVRKKLGADIGLAVTGFAGPEAGAPDEDPVGSVYLALSSDEGERVEHYNLHGSRESIQQNAAKRLLQLLYRSLQP